MFSFRKIFVVLIAAGLLLTACGGQKATEVRITLTEFGTESSITDFKVGVPYHFVVTNEGTVNHEIMIMPPLMADQMGMSMDMGALDDTALVMIPADELTRAQQRPLTILLLNLHLLGVSLPATHQVIMKRV
jgi:hypothetical protein